MKDFRRVSCDAAVKVILLLVCWLTLASRASAQTNFSIQSIARNSDGSVTLTWPVTPMWTYHVMYSNYLTNGWQDFPDGTSVAGTNNVTLSYTDTNSVSLTQRFYKVRAILAQVIMTLVLERDGAMNPNNGITKGGLYLPSAVTDFINLFDENRDEVAMVSLATTANVDVPMTNYFKSVISTAASNLEYAGGTYSPGGLTNGLLQEESVQVPCCEATIKAVVFFSGNRANMIEQTLSCGQAFVFGGFDPSGEGAAFFPTNTPELPASGQDAWQCAAPEGGSMGIECGCSVSSYISPQTGNTATFSTDGIDADSEYVCNQLANLMRVQGIYVFAIGLTSASSGSVNSNFLYQVANDPNSPTYNPTLPTGEAVFTNDPTKLEQLFQQIAAKILP